MKKGSTKRNDDKSSANLLPIIGRIDEKARNLRRRFEEANPVTCPHPGCTVRCPVGKPCYRHQTRGTRSGALQSHGTPLAVKSD